MSCEKLPPTRRSFVDTAFPESGFIHCSISSGFVHASKTLSGVARTTFFTITFGISSCFSSASMGFLRLVVFLGQKLVEQFELLLPIGAELLEHRLHPIQR